MLGFFITKQKAYSHMWRATGLGALIVARHFSHISMQSQCKVAFSCFVFLCDIAKVKLTEFLCFHSMWLEID